jgi:hypothetical protein
VRVKDSSGVMHDAMYDTYASNQPAPAASAPVAPVAPDSLYDEASTGVVPPIPDSGGGGSTAASYLLPLLSVGAAVGAGAFSSSSRGSSAPRRPRQIVQTPQAAGVPWGTIGLGVGGLVAVGVLVWAFKSSE